MDINKSVLDNGLRVITARLPHLRTVNIAVAVGGGARYETKKNAGISHLLEHLVLDERDESEVIAILESKGALVNAFSCEEDIFFVCKVPLMHFALGVETFFDLLFRPAFSAESFECERKVILEEHHRLFGSPEDLLLPFFTEKLWEGHPLETSSPTAILEALPNISLLALERFYRCLFVPPNIVVCAVGDISHEEFIRYTETQVTGLPVGRRPRYPRGRVKSGIRVEGMSSAGEEARLAFGCETVSLFHPDRHVLDVIASYLGRGMSSQLFTRVRSEAGLVYGISASHEVFLDTGYFVVTTACAPENAEEVVRLSLLEFLALYTGEIEEGKLTAAKERLAGALEAHLEDPLSLAYGFARQELFKGEIITPDQLADKMRAVSLEDVVRVSVEALWPDKFLLVVIGPIKDAKIS